MPTSSEPTSFDQDLLNLNSYQEEPKRRRSPGRKSQGKTRKKHEKANEDAGDDGARKADTSDVISRPSILAQLRNASFTSQADLTSNLDPSLEAYSEPISELPLNVSKQNAAEWTRSVPYGRSPPQTKAASGAGSPPDTHIFKGGFSHSSPPTSPRAANRILAQRNNEYQSFGGLYGASPPHTGARLTYSAHPYQPPPPHFTQPHFYGAPDVDLGPGKGRQGQTPSQNACCVFDSIPSVRQGGLLISQDVLIVGHGTSLDIHHVQRRTSARIGRLSNLGGSVVGVKCIPSLSVGSSTSSGSALVALIIHGPCGSSETSTKQGKSEAGKEEFDASASTIQALQNADMESYQTTVEIYALESCQHVTTLFTSPKIPLKPYRWRGRAMVPPPIGSLTVEARGRFVTINSGESGEVFIYECSPSHDGSIPVTFRCIGKVWTSISSKPARSSSISSRESGQMLEEEDDRGATDLPITSMSARWLAIVPPPSSKQISIHGQVPESASRKIPGYASHTSPEQPAMTCHLDAPEAEGLINRIARDATQEFVKGARWVGSQGMQAWNKYWSTPPGPNQQVYTTTSPLDAPTIAKPPQQYFPPTHALDIALGRAKTGPALVSILDLEHLAQSQQNKETVALQPIATFSLPSGCSAMSFAPNGTQLFTASANGDTQQIWDLMRLVHGEVERSGQLDAAAKGPTVREVARYTRITEARITDVAWTRPNGEKLALTTDNGTVHVYDVPSSAFYWPPFRRARRIVSAPTREDGSGSKESEQEPSGDSGSAFRSAFGKLTGTAPPLLSSMRGRTASAGSPFTGFGGFASTAGAGAKGGKAMAAGINRSFTAAASGTVNTLRHLGENRISLSGSSNPKLTGCTRWLGGKDETLLAVATSGVVRIHTIRQSTSSTSGKRRASAVGTKPVEILIPHYPTSGDESEVAGSSGSFWLPPKSSRPSSRSVQQVRHPLSYAEIETHAPYQPFHTDDRVAFHIYRGDPSQPDVHHLHDHGAWGFGEDIPSTRIALASNFHQDDDDVDAGTYRPLHPEVAMHTEDPGEQNSQILVTTRRKGIRKGEDGIGGEEEFFEDELEVVDFAQDRV